MLLRLLLRLLFFLFFFFIFFFVDVFAVRPWAHVCANFFYRYIVVMLSNMQLVLKYLCFLETVICHSSNRKTNRDTHRQRKREDKLRERINEKFSLRSFSYMPFFYIEFVEFSFCIWRCKSEKKTANSCTQTKDRKIQNKRLIINQSDYVFIIAK